jgi:hypothetical protein
VTWTHATCFTLPKKLIAEEFFTNLQVHEDVTEAQIAQMKELLDDSEGSSGTPGGKRGSSATEGGGGGGGSNKKAKADITKGMSDAEYVV